MEEKKTEENLEAQKMLPAENCQSHRNTRFEKCPKSNMNESDDVNLQSTDSSSGGQTIGALHEEVPQSQPLNGKQSTKKASDSDNVVTVDTQVTARNSSSSSECHDTNTNQATTTTASSGSGGDDDDRRGESMNGNSDENQTSNAVKSRSNRNRNDSCQSKKFATSITDDFPPRKKSRHHPQGSNHPKTWSNAASIRKPSPKDDGSTLQVPGDDGSDRIVARNVEGGVPIKPATVVASSVPLATGDKRNSSSETSLQNHLLLPYHREPRYHTIRDTLYRFQSSDSNSNGKKHSHRSNRSKKRRRGGADKKFVKTNKTILDPLSTDEVVEGTSSKHHHHHRRRGNRSSGSNYSASTPNEKSESNASRSRSNRSTTSSGSNSSTSIPNGKPKRKGEETTPKRTTIATTSPKTRSKKTKSSNLASPNSSLSQEGNTGGSSSGSGTEGTSDGYAGSVSSNENGSGNQQLGSSSPSPSETSSEECEQQGERHKTKRNRRSKQKSSGTQEGDKNPSSSSEIADFGSSGSSETMDEEDEGKQQRNSKGDGQAFAIKTFSSSSASQSFFSSNYSDSDGLELSFLSAKRDADAEHERMLKQAAGKKKSKNEAMRTGRIEKAGNKQLASKKLKDGRPPILAMGCDVMAHILTFLHPPEILNILTMPLSKPWRQNFTSQPELWRVLCLVEPFKATMDDPVSPSRYSKKKGGHKHNDSSSSSDEGYSSPKTDNDPERLLDKYRLLYTSFVRCMKYVSQIRDDAINGRPPAYIDYGISGAINGAPDIPSQLMAKARDSLGSPPPPALGSNRNLQMFLAQARDVVLGNDNDDNQGEETKTEDSPTGLTIFPRSSVAVRVGTGHRKNEHIQKNIIKKNGPRFGRSMITSRLYSPVPENKTNNMNSNNMNLPWSCAIYSIVNWMVAFSDVEGIQTLCLKVLPVLLENEQHRLTAQHAGLADVVLRAMVIFSESAPLHIAAFHTIVLLARPHGGKEGMMFRTSMTADGIFRGVYQQHGKSGIAVMLDSMRRFQDNASLLAMSCWALVNIALVSDQKAVLVKLGGIQAITNAMYRHPFSAELQFRALFALINLVIPSVQKIEADESSNNGNGDTNSSEHRNNAASIPSEPEQLGELNETTEKEIIDELVGDVASLVVHVMKNFCSSEAILNRACLVLHNLSLTEEYHVILLWTPQCYQMLEWCVANFRSDQVLQQSATGTLQRLQTTLASSSEMRARFNKTLQTQHHNMTLNNALREER